MSWRVTRGLSVSRDLDRLGRVAGSNDVGGNVLGDHGTRADDGIFANADALADDGPIANPDIAFQRHWRGLSNRLSAIVDVMPIRVGDVGTSSQHGAFANRDGAGGIDTHAGAKQDGITDVDFP